MTMPTLEQMMLDAERRLSALTEASGPFGCEMDSIAHEGSIEGRRIRAKLLIRLSYHMATLAAYEKQEAAARSIPPMRKPITEPRTAEGHLDVRCGCGHRRYQHFTGDGACHLGSCSCAAFAKGEFGTCVDHTPPESLKAEYCECGHVRAVHRTVTDQGDAQNIGQCTQCDTGDCVHFRQRAAEPPPDDDWTRTALTSYESASEIFAMADDDNTIIAECPCDHDNPEQKATAIANARRLVACWNACMGVPTATLEPTTFNLMPGGGIVIAQGKGGASDD